MHELPWITICGHEWCDLPMIFTNDEVTSENHWNHSHVTKRMHYYISYALFCVLNTQFRWKQSSIPHFAIVAKDGLFSLSIVTSPQSICDVTLTRGTGIVTSYLLIVLERANWRKGDLHQWITTVNIDCSPPGIHGLACKKFEIHYRKSH